MKLLSKIVALFSLFSLLFAASAYGNASSFTVVSLDTIAGSHTLFETSGVSSGTKISFDVKNPYGDVESVLSTAPSNGIVKVGFSGDYTHKAGKYTVTSYFEDQSVFGMNSSFTVLPASVSASVSEISPSAQVVNSSSENAYLVVTLHDDYGNSISGHSVELVSSSSSDSVTHLSSNKLTDANGVIKFRMQSSKPGPVTYSAYDVTAGIVLDQKVRVAYFDASTGVFDSLAVGNSAGPADHLSFEEVPASVKPGESISFTISAYDQVDQSVIGYDGVIGFSVEYGDDMFVNLPSGYAFVIDDLGTHTFSLALSFQESGSFTLRAYDLSDPTVYGDYDFLVSAGNEPISTSSISISNPASGTYSNPIQVISGYATPGSNVKIFDNDIEISSLTADYTGSFSATTSLLLDGAHSFYAAEVNDVGTALAMSDTVDVNIDTSSPEISQLIFEPSGVVDAGASITAKLYVTEVLSQVALVVGENIYDLSDSGAGFYSASFPAPITFGDYPVGFILTDELGNEARYDNQSVLTVGGQLLPDENSISDVVGLSAVAEDTRVILNWDVANGDVLNYRVHYGISPNDLAEAVDTFTDANTWYIPNLTNGVEYYFGVIAVAQNGDRSEHYSNIVASTPRAYVVDPGGADVIDGVAGSDAIDAMGSDVSDSGPGIYLLIVIAFIGFIFYRNFRLNTLAAVAQTSSLKGVYGRINEVRDCINDCVDL